MRKVAVLALVIAVFFASSGPLLACELCDGLRALDYTDTQISQIIRSGANRAEAETKMRQIIKRGHPIEAKLPPQSQQTPRNVEAPAVKVETPQQGNQNPNPFAGQYTWNGKIED